MSKTDKEIAKNAKKRMARQNEYIKNSFDRVSVVMPKGYKQLITDHSKSINSFIVDAITEKLASLGVSTEQETEEENENTTEIELPFL